MNFVDEQNNVTTSFNFFQNFLQSLFKVTAISTTGDKCTQVEGVELLVGQSLRYFIGDNLLRETFDDCRLTNTRFADQHRIVLGAS